jgi:predicted lysophospholipase L1 biosynthesis ABC-type transport system permease subunit
MYVQITFEGKCAVMTGEGTDRKVSQFRHQDRTRAGIAGSFHKDHPRIVDERTPETRRRSRITKRDEVARRTIPLIVVAEQWLCFLLGLICMICGVYGLFMNYRQDSPIAYIQWLGPAYGLILRSIAIACIVLGAVLVRCGLANPDQVVVSVGQEPSRSVRANLARALNLFSAWGTMFGFGLKRKGPP